MNGSIEKLKAGVALIVLCSLVGLISNSKSTTLDRWNSNKNSGKLKALSILARDNVSLGDGLPWDEVQLESLERSGDKNDLFNELKNDPVIGRSLYIRSSSHKESKSVIRFHYLLNGVRYDLEYTRNKNKKKHRLKLIKIHSK
ncbi:hypothetical protein MJH12_19435 [bacterium]|nr:hypothetical protein [bacterium]